MITVWQDLNYAARSLRLNPAFAAIVIATLTPGIGANAAIFSVADAVMLRPFPYPDMDRVMVLNEITRGGQSLSVARPTFQDWRAQNQVFEHLASTAAPSSKRSLDVCRDRGDPRFRGAGGERGAGAARYPGRPAGGVQE